MFSTLEEAIDYADDAIFWEFDKPEKNTAGLFIQKFDDIPHGDEMVAYAKVTNYHLIDVNDFEALSAKLVLFGTALLITRASVPHFLLNGHKEVLDLELTIADEEVNQTASTMNDIIEDEARQTETILIVFPEGCVCNADFSGTFPSHDMDVAYSQRELMTSDNHHWPGYWKIRIVSTKVKKIKLKSKKKQTILEAMAGMKVSN